MNRNTYLGDNNTAASTGGMGNNLMYLLIGGGIGATLALLFAPKAGSELRQDLGSAAQRGYDGTLELAGKLKEQSGHLYDTVKDKADQIYGFAADKFNLEASTPGQLADKAIDAGTQLAADALEEGRSKLGGRQQDSGGLSKPPGNVH